MKNLQEKIIEFQKMASESGYFVKYIFNEDGTVFIVEIIDDDSLESILMFWPENPDGEMQNVNIKNGEEMIDYEILKLCVHIMESLNEK